MDPYNTPCKGSEIDPAMDVGPQQLQSHPNPVTLCSHLPVAENLLPPISNAITAQWDLDGVLALSLQTGYAGSRDRMDKGSMSALTMKPVLRKAFCARYVYSCLITWPAGSQCSLQYYIEAVHKTINADGIPMEFGKVWNHTYPGPWIREPSPVRLLISIVNWFPAEACWGDEIGIWPGSTLWNTFGWQNIRNHRQK